MFSAALLILKNTGFNIVGQKPNYPTIFIREGTIMLTLSQAKEDGDPVPFDGQPRSAPHPELRRQRAPGYFGQRRYSNKLTD